MSKSNTDSLIYHQSFKSGLFGKYVSVAKKLPTRGSVLEIGCHTGYFSAYLSQQGFDVLGIEKNQIAVDIAQQQNIPVLCIDIEQPEALNAIGKSFDIILLMDVLEHLVQPDVVLQRIRNFLKPNGKVIITGPNITYWAIRKDLLFGNWQYTDSGILDKTHLHLYSARDWQALVTRAGYNILSFDVAEGLLPVEHILLKVPVVSIIIPVVRSLCFKAYPELFASVYVIELSLSREKN